MKRLRPEGPAALPSRPVLRRDLASLIREHPAVLRVLREAGVEFCAGCWLTLSSTPERAAAYHGVPDIPRFLKRLASAARRTPGRKPSGK